MTGTARGAYEAFTGARPSFGERVDATRQSAADDAEHVTEPDPLPWPPLPGDGPWVYVRLPDDAGVIRARPIAWTRTSTGQWALRITAPLWVLLASWSGDGGTEATAAEEGQYVPAEYVIQIDGQDYSRIDRPE